MGAVLSREVVSKVHAYSEVPADTPLPQRSLRLSKPTFMCDPKAASLPLRKISSASQAAEFYSPSAALWTQRDADLSVLRIAHAENKWEKLDTIWLGQLCRPVHRLLLLRSDGVWFFSVFLWAGSAVVGIRADCSELAGTQVCCRAPSQGAQYEYLAIWDLNDWQALHYRWRPPAWQTVVGSGAPLRLAVRAFCAEKNATKDSLLKVCARQGFFQLERSILTDLATHLAVPVSGGATMLDLIWALAVHILGTDEADTLAVCSKRLASLENAHNWSEELSGHRSVGPQRPAKGQVVEGRHEASDRREAVLPAALL